MRTSSPIKGGTVWTSEGGRDTRPNICARENESGIIRVDPSKMKMAEPDLKKEKEDWNDRLSWTFPETKKMALDLKSKIIDISRNIQHQISGRDYIF